MRIKGGVDILNISFVYVSTWEYISEPTLKWILRQLIDFKKHHALKEADVGITVDNAVDIAKRELRYNIVGKESRGFL